MRRTVSVKITHEGTLAARTATSDEQGFYQVLGLVSGDYTIEAEVQGFKNTAVPASRCAWTKTFAPTFLSRSAR